MQQLTHNQKKPVIQLLDVPFPVLGRGQVLVRNHYSVISCPEEEQQLKEARSGVITRTRTRKKEVKQVIEQIKKSGLADTYHMVMNRLQVPAPLGNCCGGEVIAVSSEINDIKIGDRVACGGEGAWHADVVAVNRNLCVKIPEGVDLKQAAFAAIAAIAIQGMRQADVRLGENVVVIGLGLLGQLTIQLLQAAGIHTVGIDIDQAQVLSSKKIGADLALNRNHEDLERLVSGFTDGHGADAVIITANSRSTDPVNLAGLLCRHKGKVVVVGEIPTGFDREHYYKKELDLRMSSSYGPGRHDPVYEEKGIDYPIGYVRWTENRNMQSYMDLLRKNKLQMDRLITHTVPLEGASEAYALILNRREPFCGIVISYDIEKELASKVELETKVSDPVEPGVGFIGAGNFARNVILPVLKKRCNLIGVTTAQSNNARHIADQYGFAYATGNVDEIIADDRINTVFITTPHDLHAEFIIKALTMSKHIFVEKPLALTKDELKRVWETHRLLINRKKPLPILMVGFNRRFSPFIRRVKDMFLSDQPKAIHYRINAGKLPRDHWLYDPEVGAGVIIGEVCQFIDLAIYLSGGEVSSISAKSLKDQDNLQDTLVINLGFDNGSIASIGYFSNGHKKVSSEYLEVFSNNQVVAINDFKTMKVFGKKITTTRFRRPNMGYQQELIAFLNAIQTGSPSPIPFEELYATTLTTFAVVDSVKR